MDNAVSTVTIAAFVLRATRVDGDWRLDIVNQDGVPVQLPMLQTASEKVNPNRVKFYAHITIDLDGYVAKVHRLRHAEICAALTPEDS